MPKSELILSAIIIDDEKPFVEKILHSYRQIRCQDSRCSYVCERCHKCYKKHKPNLLFLDIDLTDGSGFDIL